VDTACERGWAVGARAAVVFARMRLPHRVIMSRGSGALQNGLCTYRRLGAARGLYGGQQLAAQIG
jgi:hypothetical protein